MQKTITPIDNTIYVEREYHSNKIEQTIDNSIKAQKTKPYGLVIHGGAGNITPDRITPELEKQYRAKLQQALEVGNKLQDVMIPEAKAITNSSFIAPSNPIVTSTMPSNIASP